MPTEPAHPLHASRLSITVALAGALLLFVFILFFKQEAQPVQPDLSDVAESDRWKYTNEGRSAKLTELRSREQAEANAYGWVDQAKGVVRLPLDRAMELTVREQAAKR